MQYTTLSLLALAAAAAASPTPLTKRADPTDVQILQYALTLEHLEDTFYRGALAKYDDAAFLAAGLPAWSRGRFAQVSAHEAIHVKYLSDALGKDAPAPCEYSFPYNDPKSFAALSQVLEGVGTSAYLGAAQFIKNPAYLTVAGAILTTEARHASWVASAANKQNPWSGAFDTPLGLNQVFSLAAPFITSCPSTNPTLPVKAFPALTIAPGARPGAPAALTFAGAKEGTFLALFTGLQTLFAPIAKDGSAVLPAGLQGTVYAVVSANGTSVSDASTLAGPAILDFPFDAAASNNQ